MTFYCFVNNARTLRNPQRLDMLRSACERRGVGFEVIEASHIDLAATQSLPVGSLSFRLSLDHRTKLVELAMTGEGVASFYASPWSMLRGEGWSSLVLMQKAGVDSIPLAYLWGGEDDAALERAAQACGGWPVVLKRPDRSHGQGVFLAHNLAELKDQIVSQQSQDAAPMAVKQFIENAVHARLIVVGDRVAASLEYIRPEDDFRTNASDEPVVTGKTFAPDVQRLAVQAVQSVGLEFGGVDILIDKAGQPFVAETNFPCNFVRAFQATGIDVAGVMVDYLREKALT